MTDMLKKDVQIYHSSFAIYFAIPIYFHILAETKGGLTFCIRIMYHEILE